MERGGQAAIFGKGTIRPYKDQTPEMIDFGGLLLARGVRYTDVILVRVQVWVGHGKLSALIPEKGKTCYASSFHRFVAAVGESGCGDRRVCLGTSQSGQMDDLPVEYAHRGW